MIAAKWCWMTTLDEVGAPRNRVVHAFEPELPGSEPGHATGDIMAVYIGCNRSHRKVSDIQRNPTVALSYFDPSTFSYVTLNGTAEIIADAEELQRHWRDEYGMFYQGGALGGVFSLIRVKPKQIEILARGDGVPSGPIRLLPAILKCKPDGVTWSLT